MVLHKTFWKTTDGRIIPIHELTDEHLINILNLIDPGSKVWGSLVFESFENLQTEAIRRQLDWRKYSGISLKDGYLKARSRIKPKESKSEESLERISANLRKLAASIHQASVQLFSASSATESRSSCRDEAMKTIREKLAPPKHIVRLESLPPGVVYRYNGTQEGITFMKVTPFAFLTRILENNGCTRISTGIQARHYYCNAWNGEVRCLQVNLKTGDLLFVPCSVWVQEIGRNYEQDQTIST